MASVAIRFTNDTLLTVNNASIANTTNSSFPPMQQCVRAEPDSRSVIAVKTSILCVIMLAALVGNLSIIIIVIKTKSLKKAVNFLLVNMAVADCLLAMFFIPHQIVPIVTRSFQWRVHGDAGLALCKLVFISIDTALVVSISSMVCLAIDRFCAIVMPLNRSLITSRVRKGAIILTWVVALGYSSPYLYIVKMSTYKDMAFCQVDWGLANLDHSKAMTMHAAFAISILGVLPWLLVLILYSIMIKEIKNSKHASHPSLNISHQKYDLKVIKLSVAIVVSFAVCNFPSSAMYLVVAMVWKWSQIVCPPLYWSSLWFTAHTFIVLYTVFNPCICFMFSENFRKGFGELFCFSRRRYLVERSSAYSRHRSSKATFLETQNNSSFEMSVVDSCR